jgi:hypothetical protein
MGIYADMQKRRAEQYDTALEAKVREWMEAVLGYRLRGATFREALMDGTAICELINKLRPGTIKKIHRSPVLMFRRENFGLFQNACVALGCKSNETCVFEDVYDDKNMGLFLINIVARQVQSTPGYSGPVLDAKTNFARLPSPPQSAGPPPQTPPRERSATTGSGYIPSAAEATAFRSEANRTAGQYTQRGVLMNPDDPSAPKPKPVPQTGYVPSLAEAAAFRSEANRMAGRYTEHGIVMNPDENPANKRH